MPFNPTGEEITNKYTEQPLGVGQQQPFINQSNVKTGITECLEKETAIINEKYKNGDINFLIWSQRITKVINVINEIEYM